jgi:cyanuric acid amidohydrolase
MLGSAAVLQHRVPVEAEVHTVPMEHPEDISSVAQLFDRGLVDPANVIAVMAQTEGGGEGRATAAAALRRLLGARLGVPTETVSSNVPMLMIGGTAGLMCPHFTLFVNRPAVTPGQPGVERLVLSAVLTRVLRPEELGTLTEVREVAAAVSKAMDAAGISDPGQVRNVQLKTPALTAESMKDAAQNGKPLCSTNLSVAGARTRGAAALGAAVALGELDLQTISEDAIGRDTRLFTQRAFASSGEEQSGVSVVVIGNVDGAPGHLRVANGVMAHQFDLRSAHQVFASAGITLASGTVREQDRPRIKAVFVKAGADAVGDVVGRRHTMLSGPLAADSGNQAKAVAHAILSGIVGDSLVLANAGPDHQGVPGSNLLCIIAQP